MMLFCAKQIQTLLDSLCEKAKVDAETGEVEESINKVVDQVEKIVKVCFRIDLT